MRSDGVLNTRCSATVNSITPSPAPRWPPVTETALIVSARNSPASCTSSASLNRRKSAGEAIESRIGVAGFVTNIPGMRRFPTTAP